MNGLARTAPRLHFACAAAVVMFILVPATHLIAQSNPIGAKASVRVGTTVRIDMPDSAVEGPVVGAVEGTVVRMDGDGWLVEVKGLEVEPLDFTPSASTRVEMSAGRETKILKGMVIGLLAGVGGGTVIGLATFEDSFFSKGFQVGAAAASFGAIGVVAGGLIGAVPREQWREVSPLPPRVRIAPSADGGLALSTFLEF